jgi:glycosyltransferase involved in cell wall biosynthesis
LKKILIIDFTSFFGGGQKFALNLEDLVGEIFEMHFAVSSPVLFGKLKTSNKIRLSNSVTSIFKDIFFINSYIKRNKIDILILNGNRPIYMSMFFINVKKIAYKHTGLNAISNSLKRIASLLLLNFSYLFVNRIALLYHKANTEVFFQKHKIYVIPNTIVLSISKKNDSNRSSEILNLVCVSRIEENKGIKFLIESYLSSYEQFSEKVFLNIVGDGPLLNNLVSFHENQNSSKLKFHGFVDNIHEILQNADIFILPSKFESFPLSILEAMSVGLPIISTNTGGIEDMVFNGENGFLVDYNDSFSMSNSMKKLIDISDERAKMGLKSLEIFNNKFSNTVFIENFKNLIFNI